MTAAVFAIGAVVAVVLLGLLVATLLAPPFRIWPTPGEKTWQSYVFWPLFRGLNALCFAAAITDQPAGWLGLPFWLRILASIVLAGSIALFVYSFRMLGRDNSYGAQDGLVTSGIYQWSRNPQNAMLVVVYAALAVAADIRAVRGHDGGLLPDDPGRGALARGRLRRALPPLLPRGAAPLQLAPRRCQSARDKPLVKSRPSRAKLPSRRLTY